MSWRQMSSRELRHLALYFFFFFYQCSMVWHQILIEDQVNRSIFFFSSKLTTPREDTEVAINKGVFKFCPMPYYMWTAWAWAAGLPHWPYTGPGGGLLVSSSRRHCAGFCPFSKSVCLLPGYAFWTRDPPLVLFQTLFPSIMWQILYSWLIKGNLFLVTFFFFGTIIIPTEKGTNPNWIAW